MQFLLTSTQITDSIINYARENLKKNIIKDVYIYIYIYIYIYDLGWIIDKLYCEILIEIRCGIHKYIYYMKDKIRNCFDKF